MAAQVRMTEVYRKWINSFADRVTRARIQVRVDRLVHGHLGRHRRLAGGIGELKIDIGSGYRVYYTARSGGQVILLAAGDKSTQRRDIELALALARDL